jgi:glycogen operon protein
MSQLMREHVVLRRRKFFQGRPIRGAEFKDVMWLAPDGREMTEAEWNARHVQCLGVRLAGDVTHEVDENGDPIVGDTLVYLMNAAPQSIQFALPAIEQRPRWECLLDTYDDSREGQIFDGGYPYPLGDRSVAVFRLQAW